MRNEEAQSPLAINIMYFIRWGFISCCIGVATGVVGSIFGRGVIWTSSPDAVPASGVRPSDRVDLPHL